MSAIPDVGLRFAIDPRIDAPKLGETLTRRRRVHIPGLFRPSVADALYREILQRKMWTRNLLADGWDREIRIDDSNSNNMTDREAEELAYASAKTGFSFLYERHWREFGSNSTRRSDAVERCAEFLHSREFLDFGKRLTGMGDIDGVVVQITRYRPGHFLTPHNDDDKRGRCAAYVLNLTPRWMAEWGGVLEFPDADGNLEEAFVPRFNALNVFLVPQLHSVSLVAPFAGAPRYAISGWFTSSARAESSE